MVVNCKKIRAHAFYFYCVFSFSKSFHNKIKGSISYSNPFIFKRWSYLNTLSNNLEDYYTNLKINIRLLHPYKQKIQGNKRNAFLFRNENHKLQGNDFGATLTQLYTATTSFIPPNNPKLTTTTVIVPCNLILG